MSVLLLCANIETEFNFDWQVWQLIDSKTISYWLQIYIVWNSQWSKNCQNAFWNVNNSVESVALNSILPTYFAQKWLAIILWH